MLSLILAVHCLFSPPDGWEIADPQTPSNRVLVGFINKKKTGFSPSMNLTYEKVTIPTQEYLEIVQENCRSKKQTTKLLGMIETKAGKAHLLEIETQTKFGPVRLMQALLRKEEDLYILTAATLKKDFAAHAKTINEAFQSMTLCEDLFQLANEDSERLRSAWQKKRSGVESSGFEEIVIKHKNLGPVWQLLVSML